MCLFDGCASHLGSMVYSPYYIYKAIYKWDIPYRTGDAPTSRMNVSDYIEFIYMITYDYMITMRYI
jgi:hypothetical protein